MGENFLLTKPINFGINGKNLTLINISDRTYNWFLSVFFGYWPSKNASRDHGIEGEFVSLPKPIVFAIESIAGFCTFWDYWPSKNGSRNHDVKGEFVSLAKPVVFGTNGKRILWWSIIAAESIADFSLFLSYWSSKSGSRGYRLKGEFVSLAKPIVFGTAGKKVSCRLTFA